MSRVKLVLFSEVLVVVYFRGVVVGYAGHGVGLAEKDGPHEIATAKDRRGGGMVEGPHKSPWVYGN